MLKEKVLYVYPEKSFDSVPRKVLEWAMRKKGIPEVISLYAGAETKVRVDSELSEEFGTKVGMHKGFVLSSYFYQLW